MPSARVAAAATGLPKSTSPTPLPHRFDFHIHLCQLIGEVAIEEDGLQKRYEATQCPIARQEIERAMDDTYDRRNALMMALSAEQAKSLGAAAAQMAAACNLVRRATLDQESHPEDERAIERLIQSASVFVTAAAGFSDVAVTGVNALFEPAVSRWAPPDRPR